MTTAWRTLERQAHAAWRARPLDSTLPLTTRLSRHVIYHIEIFKDLKARGGDRVIQQGSLEPGAASATGSNRPRVAGGRLALEVLEVRITR
jgi:hypothetical protein